MPKTLRDEFAMAALTGILDTCDDSDQMLSGASCWAIKASAAYGLAEAMMEERKKYLPTEPCNCIGGWHDSLCPNAPKLEGG